MERENETTEKNLEHCRENMRAQAKFNVLIAEDEEPLLDALVHMVNEIGGFRVVGMAQTGKQALELCSVLMPDVLITDIRMPVMDGMALLEAVKEKYPETACLITSGYSEFEYAKKAIHLQVVSYLLKPINPVELKEEMGALYTKLLHENSIYLSEFDERTATSSPKQIASLLREYIKANYHKTIHLNMLAHSLGYSPGYLTKLFVSYYNIKPVKYINQLKINKAKSLLKNHSEYSIKAIGEMIGYDEQAYFSRIFKKNVGMSPLDYREKGVENEIQTELGAD